MADTDPLAEHRRVTRNDHRSNNFDALRLIGALAVVFGHSYPLTDASSDPPVILGWKVHSLGVVIFFTISGYLITASWSRTRSVRKYLAARFLRIFPGLILIVLVSALVIGPWATTMSVGDYFSDPMTPSYVIDNILMYPQYSLPGVWAGLPYPVVVNGSLWTLPAEFFCYLAVPVLFLLPQRLRCVGFLAGLGASLYLSTKPAPIPVVIWGSSLSDVAQMWVFFAAGALLYFAHRRWRGLFRADAAAAVLAVYLVLLAVYPHWMHWYDWAALPYVVLTLGMARTPVVSQAARFGDLSYGTYLWSFPLQQIVIWQLGVLHVWVNLVLVGSLSLIFALASWHLVEHPSLRLKDRLAREPRHRR